MKIPDVWRKLPGEMLLKVKECQDGFDVYSQNW